MNKFLSNCGDSLREQYDSKENLIQDLYQNWLNQSIDSKLSWCRGNYHLKEEFVSEMKQKFQESLTDELLSRISPVTVTAERKLRPVRSKKKRIRAKRQKKERKMRSV